MESSHDDDMGVRETEDSPAVGNLMESKTSQLDDLLSRQLVEAFHKQTSSVMLHDVAKIASEHTAIDLAYAVSRLPVSARPVVYQNLPDLEAKIEFMLNTDKNTRMEIFRILGDKEITELIANMPTDEAVWVFDDMSDRCFRRVLELLDEEKVSRIRSLQKHGRNTAGRLMTNEFFAFTMDVTIGEAAGYIRDNPGIDPRLIFVLNQAGELQGFVPARNFIVNPHHLPLRQVMQLVQHKVLPDATRDEVVDIVERYKVPTLAVVDGDNYLLGVITYEDVAEFIEDIADETITRMAGTSEDLGAYEPGIKRFLARAPWLLVIVLGGFISATMMSFFGNVIGQFFTLVIFFVPLVTGMSGAVGIQCSTVLVRSMATGMLSSGGRAAAITQEMAVGLFIGIAFGGLCGVIVFILNLAGLHNFGDNPLAVGVVVSVGLCGACLTATLLGVFSPLIFARMRIDPAIASGPIITAFNDVLSMLMYFLLAQVVGHFFL